MSDIDWLADAYAEADAERDVALGIIAAAYDDIIAGVR